MIAFNSFVIFPTIACDYLSLSLEHACSREREPITIETDQDLHLTSEETNSWFLFLLLVDRILVFLWEFVHFCSTKKSKMIDFLEFVLFLFIEKVF